MIDPPSGWKYGFPKEIPEHVDDTTKWLLENGYPEYEVKKMGDHFFVRGWYEEDVPKTYKPKIVDMVLRTDNQGNVLPQKEIKQK